MTIVLDASAAIRLIIDKSEEVYDVINEADKVLAPSLFKAEIGNALLQYLKHNKISKVEAIINIADGVNLVTEYIDIQTISAKSINMAYQHNLSYYDALYLVIAVENNCKLVSFDKKLNKIATELGLNYL